ncbi:MAG: CorA family divalent cation transporter [Pseudomonadota bacterium]|mgnify:CR=1 FL=1
MLSYYAIHNNSLYSISDEELKNGEIEPIWIDIKDPTPDEEKLIASIFNINITRNNTIQEVKLPSCYYQQRDEVYATINIVIDDNKMHTVSIILTKDKVITTQSVAISESKEYLNHVLVNNPEIITPNSFFAYLIEARINDIDENLNNINSSLDQLSFSTFYLDELAKNQDSKLKNNINIIGKKGHLISKHHESITSIIRALNFIAKSNQIKPSPGELEKFQDLLHQVSILEEQISFLSNKAGFLLDITFGLLDIEQNAITKVLSIAALIFLPPAIIGGVYGMNFDQIPFAKSEYGFELAIFVMILFACLPYLFCKLKRWI